MMYVNDIECLATFRAFSRVILAKLDVSEVTSN